MSLKISLAFLVAITSSLGRPQGDRIVFRDEEVGFVEARSSVLPGPNTTAAFIAHPQAATNLENGDFFQGDMKLLPEQEKFYTTNETSDEGGDVDEGGLLTRTGIVNTKYRWPKNRNGSVVLPYKIDELSKYSTLERTMIKLAMEYLEFYTCVRFVERTNQSDYLLFKSDVGCYSMVGKIGGMQVVSFQKGGCFTRGTLLHEIIHALGYDHMQNHVERDQFVRINWENIRPNDRHNFNRVDPKKYSNYGTAYDYNSVMHYGAKAFSVNGKETIVPRDARYSSRIGQRRGLSVGDVDRINNMYSCKVARRQT